MLSHLHVALEYCKLTCTQMIYASKFTNGYKAKTHTEAEALLAEQIKFQACPLTLLQLGLVELT